MEALLSVRRACIAWLLLLAAGTVPTAQAPASRPAAPTSSPGRPRVECRPVRRGRTPAERGDRSDSIALRARAQIAQGRYQEAQALLTPVAAAQPDSDAALELGLLELYLGRRAGRHPASAPADGRLDARTARDYFRLARAASALAGFQDAQAFKEANSFFRDANKLAPDDPEINAAWGELFLDKHNPADAMKSFQEALRVDESHVGALIGAAQVNAGTNPPAARAALERALKINSNSVPAHLLQAELSLDDRERDSARGQHQERAVGQSQQSRSAVARRRHRAPRGQDRRIRSPGAGHPEDQSGLRRGLSRRRRPPGAQLPVRRGRRRSFAAR